MTVIETIYGKFSKYEIVKEPAGVFSNTKFYIRKDGKPHRGPFSRLDIAVETVKKEAGK